MNSAASGSGSSSEKRAKKRKTNDHRSAGPSKKPRASKGKGNLKQKENSQEVWPEYFNSVRVYYVLGDPISTDSDLYSSLK